MPFPVTLSPELLTLATQLNVRPEDIDEFFIRGSGKGGQKVNKTSSTVQLVHRPTGTEVRVQRFREQSKNRIAAYILLIRKIEVLARGEESKIQKKQFKIRKQKARRSRKAKEKMLQEKKHRGEIKQIRRTVSYPSP